MGREGDGKEPIYILRGLFEAAANAGIVYTFADVELFISRRARTFVCEARILEAERSQRRLSTGFFSGFLPTYYDSVGDVPENFFSQIRDTHEKQFFLTTDYSLVEIQDSINEMKNYGRDAIKGNFK